MRNPKSLTNTIVIASTNTNTSDADYECHGQPITLRFRSHFPHADPLLSFVPDPRNK